MNGFFEIIAEGAMLEAAVAEKYLLTGVNESNAGEYISDKAYAAAKTIKKLYETVMNAIDEVINKVLNYKDEKMLGFAAAQFKKHKFDATKKTVEFRAEVVKVEKFADAAAKLKTFVSGDFDVKQNDDVLDKDSRTEAEKAALTKLKTDYFGKIDANKDVKLDSMSDIKDATRTMFINKEEKVALNADLYGKAEAFITGRGDNSVATLLKNLRELKSDLKREYQTILSDINDKVRSIKKDADDDRNYKNIKKNSKVSLKLDFNVCVAAILALMSVIKEGVKYCRIMSKAIANKSTKKTEDSNKQTGEKKEGELKPENGSTVAFIESALAEAELDLY